MASTADSPSPAQLLIERLPPELTDAKGREAIQTVFDSVDQLIVQDTKGELRADEAVFRASLEKLELSTTDVDRLIASWPDIFTSTPGLPKVGLTGLQAQEPTLTAVTAQDLDEAGLRVGSDAVAMRDAFLAAYGQKIDDAILNVDSDEMTRQLRAALQSTQPTPTVSGSEFLACLQRRMVFWVILIVINVLALLGIVTGLVTGGAIVVGAIIIPIAIPVLFWLLVVFLGLVLAIPVINCLTGVWR